MTRPRADEATGMSADTRARPQRLRSSFVGTRLGPWLVSLLVVAGAVVLITLTGTGGAATQVPSAIQIGRQTSHVTSSVPTTTPRPSSSSTVPTTVSTTRRTTVITPLSTVTDHEDTSNYDRSNATTAGSATSTTTTAPSSSVDN